jgi:membrane protease YdiL (CAAX protease family)
VNGTSSRATPAAERVQVATDTADLLRLFSIARLGLSALTLLVAVTASVLVAVSNSWWFDALNSLVHATDGTIRGLMFSSWLLVIGVPPVAWRPSAFGMTLGNVRSHVRLAAATILGSVVVTAGVLRLVGATPYSDASLLIEVVDVPVTEELVFRAVLLTALFAVLGRLWPVRVAGALAVAFDAVAFGAAHLANLTTNASAFTLGQAAFATILGGLCAFLMVRTRSVYPAVLLHAAVNATVVVVS